MKTIGQRNPTAKLAFAIAFALAASTPLDAFGFDKCDNVNEPGEPIPWVEVGYLVHFLWFAEKYCGAKPPSMTAKVLNYIESEGCGRETAVYSEMKADLGYWEALDVETYLQPEDEAADQLSPEQVQEAAEAMAEQLGGCPKLLALHLGSGFVGQK